MTAVLALLAAAVVTAACLSVTRANLVHAALWLVVTLVGVALLFVHLGAGFLGWVQMLVYVGAVAVLIVFAVLLTRGGETDGAAPVRRRPGRNLLGVVPAVVFGVLVLGGVARLPESPRTDRVPEAPARVVGARLAGDSVVALQVIGLILTAALVGAAVLALPGGRREGRGGQP